MEADRAGEPLFDEEDEDEEEVSSQLAAPPLLSFSAWTTAANTLLESDPLSLPLTEPLGE